MIRQPNNKEHRSGVVLVEFALVVSVFAIFMAGIVEFGHAYMVLGTLNMAAKRGARMGAVEESTNDAVTTRATQILSKSINVARAEILVKDASVFDDPTVDPATITYDSLPDINLEEAEARQLFLVRVNVPYEDVALIPPFWAKNLTLTGMSVMRHE